MNKTEITPLLPPWRTLLPAEHGSWFMLGFPLALGLLLRPSAAGLALGGAALALFLGRPPLRRVLSGQRDPAQRRALALLLLLSATGGALALLWAGPRFLLPLAVLSPLVILALKADLDRSVRNLWVELAAQGAFAGLAAALLLAGGGPLAMAAQAWALATLLGGANLAHVRHRLGQAHGLPVAEVRRRRRPVHALHLLLLAASALLARGGGPAGWAWTGWSLLLYLRALAPYRPMPARALGWREGGLSILGLGMLLWALR